MICRNPPCDSLEDKSPFYISAYGLKRWSPRFPPRTRCAASDGSYRRPRSAPERRRRWVGPNAQTPPAVHSGRSVPSEPLRSRTLLRRRWPGRRVVPRETAFPADDAVAELASGRNRSPERVRRWAEHHRCRGHEPGGPRQEDRTCRGAAGTEAETSDSTGYRLTGRAPDERARAQDRYPLSNGAGDTARVVVTRRNGATTDRRVLLSKTDGRRPRGRSDRQR